MKEFDYLSDYFILRMYELVRREVLASATSGTPAKRRAQELRLEIDRRGLFCAEIDWPEYLEEAGGDACGPTAGRPEMTSN